MGGLRQHASDTSNRGTSDRLVSLLLDCEPVGNKALAALTWYEMDARMISFEYMVHEYHYVSNCQQLPILPDQSWLHTHALYMIIPKIRNHRTKVYNSDQFMQLETVGRCEELCRRAWQNCYSGPCRTDKSNVACVGIASCRLANLCFQTTPAWMRVRVQRSLTCTHWGALLVGVWIVWTA